MPDTDTSGDVKRPPAAGSTLNIPAPRLDYLPAAMFGSVMGLTGLSLAWHLAHLVFAAPEVIATGIGLFAVFVFVVLTLAYLVKLVTAQRTVVAEYNHLIAGNLFGTFCISLLLLPLVVAHYNLLLARGLWITGAVTMIGFAWAIVGRWISQPHDVTQVTPAWIVPVVGLLDLPFGVPALQMPQWHDLMVFGLAVGLFFAIPIFTLNFGRLVLAKPLPDALQPNLLMLVAPFAVGFSAYIVTTGNDDMFADALYMLTLFVLFVLLWRLARSLPGKPFKLSWWGTSFPLAASAIAGLRYASFHPGPVSAGLAIGLLALATTAIAALLLRTLAGLVRGELRALST